MTDHDTSQDGVTLGTDASVDDELDLAAGDIAWSASGSWNTIRRGIEAQLNGLYSAGSSDDGYGMSFWVDDVNGSEAFVCAGSENYVIGFSVDKKGVVTVADRADWKPVNQAWIESNVSLSEQQIGAEMHLADSESEPAEIGEDGYVWKTILREGVWKMSPGPGQKAMPKPITVVRTGVSDPKSLTISMEELKNNFEAGAVEHVTIPTSHEDKVHENTGFVKGLRWNTDTQGREVLQAAHHFTEPDIKEKALRGTIANTSAGILFDYVNKETGKKNSAVLGHVALTNHPWLNGMNPFGVLASENVRVMAFSEEKPEINETDETSVGGEEMTEVTVEPTTPKFLSDLGLSEDEAAARLARYDELERRDRENAIQAKVDGWQADKKAPALVSVAKTLLSAASETENVLNLSENGKTVGLTAVDLIDRLMEAAPALTLSEDKVNEQKQAGDRPAEDAKDENDAANFSQAEKSLILDLYLTEGMSQEEAVAEAKRRLGTKSE